MTPPKKNQDKQLTEAAKAVYERPELESEPVFAAVSGSCNKASVPPCDDLAGPVPIS